MTHQEMLDRMAISAIEKAIAELTAAVEDATKLGLEVEMRAYWDKFDQKVKKQPIYLMSVKRTVNYNVLKPEVLQQD
jgi:hypothetical protein